MYPCVSLKSTRKGLTMSVSTHGLETLFHAPTSGDIPMGSPTIL
jgi:hypothetical protein